jgi:hypothetical protein
MRKTLKISALFLAVAGLTTIVGETFFPQTFCHVDPTCRTMTDDEKKIAKNVFGEKFNTDIVRIYERPHIITFFITLMKGGIFKAASFENIIFFGLPSFINEKMLEMIEKYKPPHVPSYNGIADRPLLVHELTHIAQYQFKIPDNRQEKSYEYKLKDGKKFDDYGFEQQAEIVKDFYIRAYPLFLSLDNTNSKSGRRKLCKWLEQEAELFKPHFQPSHNTCPKSRLD